VIAGAPDFMKEPDVVAVARTIRKRGPCGLIFVDTLAQVIAGGDENSSADLGTVIKHCRALSIVTGAMVVLIHHSGKNASKGARGHSSLRGAADTMIEVTKFEHAHFAKIYKQKDGEDGEEFGFTLKVVPLGSDANGEIVSSCVVEHKEGISKGRKMRKPRGAIQEKIAHILPKLSGPGNDWISYDNLVQAVKAELIEDTNAKRDTREQRIKQALQPMVDNGEIEHQNAFYRYPVPQDNAS
jgi:hypothetical protein